MNSKPARRAIAWLLCIALAGGIAVLGMALFVSTWESTTSVTRRALIAVVCWPSLAYFTMGGAESSRIFTQFFFVNGVTWALVLILTYEAMSRIGRKPQNKHLEHISDSANAV